jgi:plastocyanin
LLSVIGIVVQLSLLLCAVLATGCSDREREREAHEDQSARNPPRPQPAYEPIPVRHSGTITGVVSWFGARPEPVVLPVPHGRELCGATQPSPALALGRRGGIAGTVVWLEGVRRGRPLEVPTEPLVIVLEGCAFRPHVITVPLGARIVFRNAEPLLHNVRASLWRGRHDEEVLFSRALPEPGTAFEVTLDRPGIVRLVDDAAHPWMLGWIHVFPHPYHAVSDGEGRFHLSGIPAGHYVLRAWHEGVRVTGETEAGRPVYSAPIVLARPVTVAAGHDTTVDFVITPDVADAAGD